jgi:hypothetical protein
MLVTGPYMILAVGRLVHLARSGRSQGGETGRGADAQNQPGDTLPTAARRISFSP